MLRSIWIAVGAAVLLAVGALTAAAANSHGKTVSTLATGTTLKGEAKGDAISTLASTKSDVANAAARDRKSTRLNSSHLVISYAVFCLKKKKKRILVIILLLHFLSLMLGSVLVLMLPLLVWLTPDLRIKKSLLKCNWTIRKRLPRCKMRLKKRLLAFSRRLHARIRKTRYMHKMIFLLINRRRLLLPLPLLWKSPIFPSNSRFPRLCAKCLLKLQRLVSILPMTEAKK